MVDARLVDAAQTANETIQDRAIRHAIYLERYKSGQARAILARHGFDPPGEGE
ncbi:MAG: hypothetical protein ACO3CC_17040 [Alphaproteobacteria bacterium]